MNKPPRISYKNSQTIRDREKSHKISTFEENHNIEKDYCKKLNSYEILGIVIALIFVITFIVFIFEL